MEGNISTYLNQRIRGYLEAFQDKGREEGQPVDLIDEHREDMQCYREVIQTLQVMEGVLDIEKKLKYSFLNPQIENETLINSADSASLIPSIMSGPRRVENDWKAF